VAGLMTVAGTSVVVDKCDTRRTVAVQLVAVRTFTTMPTTETTSVAEASVDTNPMARTLAVVAPRRTTTGPVSAAVDKCDTSHMAAVQAVVVHPPTTLDPMSVVEVCVSTSPMVPTLAVVAPRATATESACAVVVQ